MTKFRYYIADISEGTVLGTDSRETAEEYALMGPDAFVCDTETGCWLCDGLDGIEMLPVEPAK